MSRIRERFRFLQSPSFLKRVHFWGIWFWLGVAAVAYVAGWLKSTTFISLLSIVALSLAHWAAFQGAKGEEHQEAD